MGGGGTPCSSAYNSAFDGQPGASGSVINDYTNSSICSGSTLSSGSGANNLAIAQNASTGIIGAPNPAKEIFAEAFAWNAYIKTLSNPQYNDYLQKTTDGLFANGYFACTVAYANSALTGSTFTGCP
jgi:hypothetical protein